MPTQQQRISIHVRHGSSSGKSLPDTTSSQSDAVRNYLTRHIYNTQTDIFHIPMFSAKVYERSNEDWSQPLLSSDCSIISRPKTRRAVVTGLPNKRVSRLHVGCTVSAVNRGTQLQHIPKYFTSVN